MTVLDKIRAFFQRGKPSQVGIPRKCVWQKLVGVAAPEKAILISIGNS